jgi:hypothetical protein
MSHQVSLFDLLDATPAPAAPAPVPPAEPALVGVHWIWITTRAARTACGISMPAYYHKLGCGYSAAGEKLPCTHNRDDGTVTCPQCLEAMDGRV